MPKRVKKNRQPLHYTAWHPLFAFTVRRVLPPGWYTVLSELQLNHQPLRPDIVVVRKGQGILVPTVMRPMVRRLGPITLIEFKGPTVALMPADLQQLLAYAPLYCLQAGITDPKQVHLMVAARQIPQSFVAIVEAYGGKMVQEEAGVWAVQGLSHPLFCIETEVTQDHVLHFYSREFLSRPRALFSLLSDEERAIFRGIYREVVQFKNNPQSPLRYADYEEFTMSVEEFVHELIEMEMPESLLKAVQRLSPEKLARVLPPEARLMGLSPEARLKGLPPEERVKGLSPEERLKGLSPEELDQLARLIAERQKH